MNPNPAETEAYAAAWAHDPNAGWLDPATNPLGVPTEREVYVLKANVEVYRWQTLWLLYI